MNHSPQKMFKLLVSVLLLAFSSLHADWIFSCDDDPLMFEVREIRGWKDISSDAFGADVVYLNNTTGQKIAYLCDFFIKPVTQEDYDSYSIVGQNWVEICDGIVDPSMDNWEITFACSLPRDKCNYIVFESKDPRVKNPYAALFIFSLDDIHIASICLFTNDKSGLPDDCINLMNTVHLVRK